MDLYSGAVFIQQTLGWNLYVGVIFLLVIATIFTAFGGLSTVIFTDALAVCIMVIGGVILCIMGAQTTVEIHASTTHCNLVLNPLLCKGFVEIGGLTNLGFDYMRAVPTSTLENPNTTCGYPRDDALHIFRYLQSIVHV